MSRWRALVALVALALVSMAATGCGGTATPERDASGRLTVVAAEDMWGSIARQLGGGHVSVTSIIDNPNADPHDYEPTADDARAIARAHVVIVNGIGYDAWATDLVAASPSPDRIVVDVGTIAHLHEGDNPHQWYSPDVVATVIAEITRAYRDADEPNALDYDRLRAKYDSNALTPYRDAIAGIRTRFGRTPIGATESLATPIAAALGLDLVTPERFLDAVGEGSEPRATDVATVDAQISRRAIRALILNPQNATPDVKRLADEARAAGVPVVEFTETLTPRGATFQDWQTAQLAALEDALAGGHP